MQIYKTTILFLIGCAYAFARRSSHAANRTANRAAFRDYQYLQEMIRLRLIQKNDKCDYVNRLFSNTCPAKPANYLSVYDEDLWTFQQRECTSGALVRNHRAKTAQKVFKKEFQAFLFGLFLWWIFVYESKKDRANRNKRYR